MSKMNIKVGDTVIILTGDDKDRGKTGKVLEVSPKEGKVIVEGRNMVKSMLNPARPVTRPVLLRQKAQSTPARYRLSARSVRNPPVLLTSFMRTVKKTAFASIAVKQSDKEDALAWQG